jgi:SAM-dependent methyltransferase
LGADLLSTPDSPHSPRIDPPPDNAPDAAAIYLDIATADADLVITSLPPHHGGPCASDHLMLLAARLLRVGGLLAVLTHSDWSTGELLDPTGPLVASAQNADLLYLQHIVALHTSLRDGQPPSVTKPSGAHGRGFVPPHRRISSDVLVFAQPRDHQQPPTVTTGAEGDGTQ